MEVVVVGGGKLGKALCEDLAQEGHEIVLIDKDEEIVNNFMEDLDIRGVIGNGSARIVQEEANVPDCNFFIAVTPSDETNLIAATIASKIGADFSIARVRSPEYAHDLPFFQEELKIDRLINPDAESAAEILRVIDHPAASQIEPFGGGLVNLVKIRVQPKTGIIGMDLAEIRARIPDILLCVIERNDGPVLIPKGNTVVENLDAIHVVGTNQAIDAFSALCGYTNKAWKSAFIIGGSRTAFYLIPGLLKRNVQVKVIETNQQKAEQLAISFPEAHVVHGDGTNQKYLREMRLANYDVAVALTNIDEENLMFSLYAHKLGVQKTITKVNRKELVALLDPESLDSIITRQITTSDQIIRIIRSHSKSRDNELETYARLGPEGVEGLEFIAQTKDQVCKARIADLQLKPGIILAHILRGKQRILPTGADIIQPGDQVLIITLNQHIISLDQILRKENN